MSADLDNDRYVTRLRKKLLVLDTEGKLDFAQIDKAIYWAIKYHAGQYRQSGEPYYSHPLEVAYMVADYLLRTDIIITAILHDTIEDTSLTAEMIETAFGDKIAGQVEDLTRIKPGGKISSAELVDSLWLQKKYDVLLVKQFDRLHNMQTIGAKSPEKIRKIAVETVNSFLVLAIYFEDCEVEQELLARCYKALFIDEREQEHFFAY